MPMVLHRADIDRRSSILDRRYRLFLGKNATAANSFDNSMVNCRQRESSVITVATYVATKICWPHMWPANFCTKQAVETLTRIGEDAVERCRQLNTDETKDQTGVIDSSAYHLASARIGRGTGRMTP